jgi:hypothetical protein
MLTSVPGLTELIAPWMVVKASLHDNPLPFPVAFLSTKMISPFCQADESDGIRNMAQAKSRERVNRREVLLIKFSFPSNQVNLVD